MCKLRKDLGCRVEEPEKRSRGISAVSPVVEPGKGDITGFPDKKSGHGEQKRGSRKGDITGLLCRRGKGVIAIFRLPGGGLLGAAAAVADMRLAWATWPNGLPDAGCPDILSV